MGKELPDFFEKVDATEGSQLMDRKRKPGIYLLDRCRGCR